MKLSFLYALALLTACTTTHAQLRLNSGDVFTYEFSSLSPSALEPFPMPLGNYSAILNPTTVEAGDTILLDMFENSLAEAPICSRTFTGSSLVSCQVPSAWADLQGAIRMTMLSGSVTLDTFTLRAITPTGGTPPLQLWESMVVPVPEPSTIALLSSIFLAGFVWRIRSHRIDHAA